MPTSNNLYVELISPGAEIIDRKVIRLNKGLGRGDFKLKDSLAAGLYKVRAYTNWMLNFGDNFVFEKVINVSSDNISKDISAASTTAKKSPISNTPSASEIIRFFPEGGSLVDGVASVVAFKAENASGKGVKARGGVLSAKGDTLVKFESNALGFGSFLIKPEAGTNYQIKGKYDNKLPFTATLPEILPQGFSLHLMRDTSNIVAIISTNAATLTAFKGRELELKVRHGGIAYFTKKNILESAITRVSIPLSGLPAGLSAFTISDDKQRPHSERLIYLNKNSDAAKIIITSNKAVYRSKEVVSLRIKALNANNLPAKSNLSVAVVDAGIVPENKNSISSYINLESELRGEIENPKQYFDLANPNRFKQLDLLLMTQGWRDFVWRRLKDTTIKITHLNETGFTISGRVNQKSGNKPVAGANVTLFANGATGQKLLGTSTDQEGRFYFDNMNLEGSQSIKLTSTDSKAKRIGELFMDSLLVEPLRANPAATAYAESPLLALFRKEAGYRSQEVKKLDLSDTIQLKEVAVRRSNTVHLFEQSVTSFGYPDQSFVVTEKDEKDYKSLRHYLLTNVNGSAPDPNPERNGVVFSSQGKSVLPRFVVDRREDLFSRMDYYELPMKDIQKIVVRHMVGSALASNNSTSDRSGTSGFRDVYLVYLTLKPSAFGRREPSLINTFVNGYYQHKMFYEPRYPAGMVSLKQDLRTTIHWQPVVTTNANGEATIRYYNADPKTKIRVVVEGINESGAAVSGSHTYDVK